MRILVTGAKGFTGAYLDSRLRARGHDIVACNADLRDSSALRQAVRAAAPEAVVHLAGNAFAANDSVVEYYDVNTLGTVRLLEAITSTGNGKIRVVLASTATIYQSMSDGILAEDTPAKPGNHYANSKWSMERAIGAWRNDLDIVLTRPFNYTGIGQDPKFLVPKIVDHFRRRAPGISLGNLDVARDFGDVRDVVEAYIGLVELPETVDVLNICTGQGTTVRQILAMAKAITGHAIEVSVNPAFVRVGEPAFLIGDNTRLGSLLPDWSSRPFEETLRWMLA